MWKCHKCGKPVYFAERKQSLGYDWHPECLRCEECGKRLNPGQHAEHKGVPYCHVPCYGALFGPQLFGHGTRVESHKNFGVRGGQQAIRLSSPALPRNHLESKLKVYNQFYDNKSMEIRSREVNNRLILEGALRVYWGVQGVIHLKEDDDQRTFVVRKRNSCRLSKAEKDNLSDKENEEASVSFEGNTTTSDQVENLSTDVSLSESISFDSCSLNEYTELPTTPEDASANVSMNAPLNELNIGREKIENSTSDDFQSSNTTSCLLPSNLCDVNNIKCPNNVTIKQYTLNHITSASLNESSSITACSSGNLVSNHLVADARCSDDNLLSPTSSSSNSTSSDNFLTATASMATTTSEANTDSITTASSATVDNYETDEATLKPMDFEEFKRSVHQDYVNGANSFQTAHQDSLKRNQPIDPSRINDSLKLYNATDNPMSKSFNCLTEHPLRSVDVTNINDPPSLKVDRSSKRRIPFNLQKSDSGQTSFVANGRHVVNAINRSKSGPSCIDFSDSDTENEATLKPPLAGSGDHISATIRKSNIPPRCIQIQMDCYTKEDNDDGRSHQDNLPSATTHSSCAAGDELTQTEEMYTVTDNTLQKEEQPLHITEEGVVLRKPPRTGATAIKRRSGNRRSRTKLKRRCSINGHFYNRETSFFTPPYGSQMSVWVTSLVTTQEVINLLLEKYKVDSMAENFSLFIIRDNGEQKRLKDSEYPLITRIMLGPHEDVAKLFLVDGRRTDEISNEVAQFINLSLPECRAILERYDQEMERETMKIKEKFAELKRRIVSRMESLKVHL